MASQAAADRQAMPPPAPRAAAGGKRRAVLEEDTYAEAIEAIVERDFFPHLPKLQNQLEWLQAVQSGDPAQIKRAQLNIARRRAGMRTPLAHEAPPTAAITPGTSLLRTPAMTPAVAGPAAAGAATPGALGVAAAGTAAGAAAATPARTPAAAAAAAALEQQAGLDPVSAQQAAGARAPALGLDAFFGSYQGEDNASFQSIQAATIQRKRAKMTHHLTDKNVPLLLEAGCPETDEYGTSGQAPGTLVMAKHVPKNSLYYDTSQRPALALTAAEAATIVEGPPKAINHAATRSLNEPQETVAAGPGAGGKLAAAVVAPGTSGYGYMRTPQLLPGVEASPLMTWGDIAGTPLRLDGGVEGGGGGDLMQLHELEALVVGAEAEAEPGGRQFSMPEVRRREVAARAMVAGRGAAALAAARRRGSGRGGGAGSSTTPLLDSLRRGGATPGSSGGGGGGGATPAAGKSGVSLSAAGLRLAQQLKRPGSSVRGAGAGGSAGGSAGGAAGAGGLAGAADLQLRASYKGGATPSRGTAVVPGRWATPGSSSRGVTPGGPKAAGPTSGSIRVQQKQAAVAGSSSKQAGAQQQQQPVSGNITDDLLQLG